MVLGLVIYLSGRKWLPKEQPRTKAAAGARVPLTGDEWKAIAVLIGLIPVLAVGAEVTDLEPGARVVVQPGISWSC